MKKSILLFCLTLLWLAGIHAQNFAPIGAKWYYSHDSSNDPPFPYTGYISLESIGDTVINGTQARVIEIKNSMKKQLLYHEYLAQQNDSILYYNPYLNRFVLLYNFSAKKGDTIHVHTNKTKVPPGFLNGQQDSIELFGYVITKIDSVQIGDSWFRRQHVSDANYGGANWSFNGMGNTNALIVSKFGSDNYLFGYTRLVSGFTTEPVLRCYEDTNTSYKNPNWDKACDYENGWQSTGEIPFNDYQVRLYPNPCKDILNIILPAASPSNISYSITNVLGSRQIGGALTATIDISTLAQGVYILNVYQNESVLANHKFIKP